VEQRVTLAALFLEARQFNPNLALCLLLLVCAALEQAGNKSHEKEKPRDWTWIQLRGFLGVGMEPLPKAVG
jgi:hypothetical protein